MYCELEPNELRERGMHFHPVVRQRHSYFELACLGWNELSFQALSSTERFRVFLCNLWYRLTTTTHGRKGLDLSCITGLESEVMEFFRPI